MKTSTVSLKKWLVILLKVGVVACFLMAAFIFYTNLVAVRAGEGRLYDEVSQVPAHPVGLLFGTTDKVGERDNLYFTHRIDAAVELWEAGKVQVLARLRRQSREIL